MKSDPFGQQPAPVAAQPRNKRENERPKEKEVSMEDKLAMLLNKFKKQEVTIELRVVIRLFGDGAYVF